MTRPERLDPSGLGKAGSVAPERATWHVAPFLLLDGAAEDMTSAKSPGSLKDRPVCIIHCHRYLQLGEVQHLCLR